MIRRIGVRAHDFGKNTIRDIAIAIGGMGFHTTQLALKKALAGVDDFSHVLNPETADSIKAALSDKNIDISVLGCYLNYGQKNSQSRLRNIEIFLKHIDLCADFGARMVGTETGSLNDDYSVHRDNNGEQAYRIFADSVEKMVEYAEQKNVIVAIEAVSKHIINTPVRMKRIVDDIASDNLVVIFDPVNLITPDNYKIRDDIIKEYFDLLGDKILAVHAKDFIIKDASVSVAAPGKGKLNFEFFLGLMKKTTQKADILLENIRPYDMAQSKSLIEEIIGERN
jgi:sugar phosphate isomerase/epimerase